jgi:EVE domain-containing protein
MITTKYWVATVSKEHAMRGVSKKFIQVCHGKQAPLKRMKKVILACLFVKTTMEKNEKCQTFTAVGRVIDDDVYQFQMTQNFKPFRRNIEFLECQESSIIPLINDLEFILNKKTWGYPFRFGFFEIKENDFNLIASRMLQIKRFYKAISSMV